MYEIFSDVPPTKILAPPLYIVYIMYIYVVTCAPPPFLYVADPMNQLNKAVNRTRTYITFKYSVFTVQLVCCSRFKKIIGECSFSLKY